MFSAANIIERISRRSPAEIVKILKIYVTRSIEDVRLRYDSRQNKQRSEEEWLTLLGFQAGNAKNQKVSEQFHTDENLTLPKPLCSDQYVHDSQAVKFFVQKTMQHKFNLLGSGWQEVKYSTPAHKENQHSSNSEDELAANKVLLRNLIVEANPESIFLEGLAEYQLIDWQQDFKSNFRWQNNLWSRKVMPGAIAGVDIKVPWELSRFYHAGPLGYYWFTTKQKNVLDEFQLQILDWISANPLYFGVNWRNSMEVGIRALNWLLGLSYFQPAQVLAPEFVWIVQKSLYQHANFIIKNLEKNSFGANNHYLGNLIGLIAIAASAPWMPKSDFWLIFAVYELMDEMKNQVHDDGTHFEASTSYHRLVAEIFLQCFSIVSSLSVHRRMRLAKHVPLVRKKLKMSQNLDGKCHELDFEAENVFPQWFVDRLSLMVSYIDTLSKVGDELPQIGDNDSGRLSWLPVPFQLNDTSVTWKLNSHIPLLDAAGKFLFCGHTNHRSQTKEKKQKTKNSTSPPSKNASFYHDSGVAIYRRNKMYMVVSCGKNGGNSDLGGHAHNDKMSFELAFHDNDIVVDPGTYVYTPHPEERNRFRSTWMHNTVAFPDKEQNPINENHLFELPDKALPRIISFEEGRLLCEHRGFGFKCSREFFITDNQIKILDTTEQPGGYCIINLHPDVCYNAETLSRGRMAVKLTHSNINKTSVLPSFYSPRYGVKIPNNCLMLERNDCETSLCFSWN